MHHTLKTDNPIAVRSLEYLHPAPYKDIPDKSSNLEFNKRLELYRGPVLDIGCGGGRFVKDCLDSGRSAVGVEGSPHFFNNKWSEWVNIPSNLFFCDITEPFSFDQKFGMVTAWEVMEHIPKRKIGAVLNNVRRNIVPGGLFFVSISNKVSLSYDEKVDYHVTKEDKGWWVKRFEKAGFIRQKEEEKFFDGSWVRNERGSFHLVWKL